MKEYNFLIKGYFEKLKDFEKRLNDHARKGWKAISMSNDPNGRTTVLIERGN